MSTKQNDIYNENLLEELISQNEEWLSELYAEKYATTDDYDEFENWLSNLDLEDAQRLINIHSPKE